MNGETWRSVLVAALALNAALGFAYRLYRFGKGGPRADVVGQAILGLLLGALALAVAAGAGWSHWVALAYGVAFGLLVMPLWTVAVFIPMRPGTVDALYAGVYWSALAVIVVAALVVA
jgi:hypothetical protein